MESLSQPSKIQCSAYSARLLRQRGLAADLQLIPRGHIFVKGKGRMETYFVQQATDNLSLENREGMDQVDDTEYSL